MFLQQHYMFQQLQIKEFPLNPTARFCLNSNVVVFLKIKPLFPLFWILLLNLFIASEYC